MKIKVKDSCYECGANKSYDEEKEVTEIKLVKINEKTNGKK